jgi:hypothetical protein
LFNCDYRYGRNKSEAIQNHLTRFGFYLLKLLQPQKGFLGLKKENDYKEFIDDILVKDYLNYQSFEWLIFLQNYFPDSIINCEKYFFNRKEQEIKFDNLYFLIENASSKVEAPLLRILSEVQIETGKRFSIYKALNEKLNGKYHKEIVEIGEKYYNTAFRKKPAGSYYYDQYTENGYLSVEYARYLLQCDKEQGRKRIERYLAESDFIYSHFFNFLDKNFRAESVPYLIDVLFKESAESNYYSTIFSILDKYDFQPHLSRFLEFMVQSAGSKARKQAAHILPKYIDNVFPVAIELISGKTVNQRITGALILSELNTEKANAALNEAVDQEGNDDTRDIMLEALTEKRFATSYTMEMVTDMISKADVRKKLAKWSEKWIDEEKLPKIYWKGKKELTQKEVRFLLYRMKRSKGLNSDIEARQVLNHIDRELSNKFAKAMLVAYQDSNSDSKLKYYLTLAGLLGDDDIMYNLNTLFKKNIADKRMKMAEYVIGALAMIGSNKALRIVEVIYRKFINKRPMICEAAKEALTAAASELNITMDELADRIIPNFDFDGLYRKFEVDGEEYRAFINSDFSLSFLNEDNKARKSAPANTPKELKAEFKEIEKEIRDIVKSQSGRLEKYMIEERRWPANDWHEFFFMNPIMFIYALKLVWGVFDKNNSLVNVFYCSEDSSLYDINDEEITLDDDQFVGILHPIYLSDDDRKRWHDKVYDMQLSTIFPIFERNIFKVEEGEKELNFSRLFANKKVPKGADFVNTFMVKKMWYKSSGDGGSSEFTKWFKDMYKAVPYIEGPMAFYQGGTTPATVHDIYFGTNDYSMKIKLSDLPPIFYSEVMSDIDQLIKAE